MEKEKIELGKILLADDEESILDMYSQALASAGWQVLAARDGDEVCRKIKDSSAGEIQLFLLDIIMPKKDGFDVLAFVSKDKRFAGTPKIMLTNLNRPEDVAEAKRLGAIDFWVKVQTPPAYLVRKVREVLQNHGQKDKK